MQKSELSVDEYLTALPSSESEVMQTVDAAITAAMPGRSRDLWQGTFWGGTSQTIIGYGDITQPRPKGPDVEWFALGLARQKRHYSLYVNAVEDDRYLGQVYAERLGKVTVGSASIGFRTLGDIDLDVLAELAAHVHRITPV